MADYDDNDERVRTIEVPVKLPGSLLYKWEDLEYKRLSQQTVLLSGVDQADVHCSINESRTETEIRMKGDNSYMMMPAEFWRAVSRNNGAAYSETHPKVVAHMKAIKDLKTTSMANSIVYVHKQKLPMAVLPNFCSIAEEYPSGSRIAFMGARNCPEITAGLEMQGEYDGFYSPLAQGAKRNIRMPQT